MVFTTEPEISIAPASLSIASASNLQVGDVVKFLSQLGLPALPVASAQNPYLDGQHKVVKKDGKDNHCPLNKDLQPEPLFTGKNPSFLRGDGKPKLIRHQNYQNRLPCKAEIQSWWRNSSNGVGTLGGWGDIIWLDFDTKQFDSQEECDRAFWGLLEAHPKLATSWIEQTHSGGYRLAVKPQQQPEFTNFALEPGGKHRGEALGKGRFTVLAPTIGTSGNPYRCLNRAVPVEVPSLEAIGIYPTTKQEKEPTPTPRPQRTTPIAGTLQLEQLGNKTALTVLRGDNRKGDRSASLATAYREWAGWERWATNHGVLIDTTALALAHQAGEAMGVDGDRVERIIKRIDPDQCLPAAQHCGGDESCWKRVAKLDRATFEAVAPASVRESLESPYRKEAGSVPSLDQDNGGSSGGNGGNGGDSNGRNEPSDDNPDAPFREICEDMGWNFQHCCTRQQFDGLVYRDLFGGEDGDWIVLNSAFYRWNGRYWKVRTDVQVQKLISDYGQKIFKISFDSSGNPYRTRPYENNKFKESAFKYCRSRLERDVSTTNTHLLGFNDCVVDLRSNRMMPHEKAQLLTSIIPHDYKPSDECPAIFYKFLLESFGKDQIDKIRAHTSAFLDPTAPYGKFPHLIGQSGGGKGTLGRFWNSLLGESASGSATAFSDLSTPEGRHQYLTGKRIFGFPDVGGYMQGLRAYYELVDNGGMTGRALFSATAYQRTWDCRFWVGSVSHLQIENAGDGWGRRADPIAVLSRKVERDPNLEAKLQEVKAGVIAWALAMPREQRDRILLAPPTSDRAKSLIEEAALYGDSTRSFVDACLRPYQPTKEQPELSVSNSDLHSWYFAFCQQHNYAPLGQTKFIAHLKTVLPRNHVGRSWSEQKDGQRHRISAHWQGVDRLPGVLRDVSTTGGEFENPQWVCIKRNCAEGGLEAFEEFWNPPTEPDPTPPPTDLPETPEPLSDKGVQGVQGQNSEKTALDTPKLAPSTGVQGGSTVHTQAVAVDFELENQRQNQPIVAPSIDTVNSQVKTPPVQPGHPGHSPTEQVSANQPTLDTRPAALDTLDTLPPSQTPVQSTTECGDPAQIALCCQQLELCLMVRDYRDVLVRFGEATVWAAFEQLSPSAKGTIARFNTFLMNQRPF